MTLNGYLCHPGPGCLWPGPCLAPAFIDCAPPMCTVRRPRGGGGTAPGGWEGGGGRPLGWPRLHPSSGAALRPCALLTVTPEPLIGAAFGACGPQACLGQGPGAEGPQLGLGLALSVGCCSPGSTSSRPAGMNSLLGQGGRNCPAGQASAAAPSSSGPGGPRSSTRVWAVSLDGLGQPGGPKRGPLVACAKEVRESV